MAYLAMVQTMISPKYNRNFAPVAGECVTIAPLIRRICAPNASPYTFTGTNTYLVGGDEIFIIDPGPDQNEHLNALARAMKNQRLKAILLTHTHKDHCALSRRLAEKFKAPIWFGGKHRLSRKRRFLEANILSGACDWQLRPDRELKDGQRIKTDGITLEVIATPGHCANHISFGVSDRKFLFSGDHVMGWNSTLVAAPDGSLNDYLNSLKRLIESRWSHYLPGHGGEIADKGQENNAISFTRELLGHRQGRNEQILQLVKNGTCKKSDIVDAIYPDASGKIRIAAMMTVTAHLEYLEEKQELTVRRGLTGNWISLQKTGRQPDESTR